jgi:hypothetical protein
MPLHAALSLPHRIIAACIAVALRLAPQVPPPDWHGRRCQHVAGCVGSKWDPARAARLCTVLISITASDVTLCCNLLQSSGHHAD